MSSTDLPRVSLRVIKRREKVKNVPQPSTSCDDDMLQCDNHLNRIKYAIKKLNLSNADCENLNKSKMLQLEKLIAWKSGGVQQQMANIRFLYTHTISIRNSTELNVCLVTNLYSDPSHVALIIELKHFNHSFYICDTSGFIDFIKFSLKSGPVIASSYYCNGIQFEIIRFSKVKLSPVWLVLRDTNPVNLNSSCEASMILSDEIWTQLYFDLQEIDASCRNVFVIATKCSHILQSIIYKCVKKIHFLTSVEKHCIPIDKTLDYNKKTLINSITQLTIEKYQNCENFKIIYNLQGINLYELIESIAKSLSK
jgi:hypothetical protein